LPGRIAASDRRYRYFRGHLPYGLVQRVVPTGLAAITMLRDPIDRFVCDFAFVQDNTTIPMPFDRRWLERLTNC